MGMMAGGYSPSGRGAGDDAGDDDDDDDETVVGCEFPLSALVPDPRARSGVLHWLRDSAAEAEMVRARIGRGAGRG